MISLYARAKSVATNNLAGRGNTIGNKAGPQDRLFA